MKWTKLDSIASTNSYISALIEAGQGGEDQVIIADYQDDGRGQGAHSWHSQKGKNLLMSILLHPAFLSASDQFQLSRLTSLALCDTLESEGLEPMIKWPNDILTNQGKIAGILIEHRIVGGKISHTIIGLGVNLNQLLFPEYPISATSFILEKGIKANPETMANRLVRRILTRYKMLEEGNGEEFMLEYQKRLYLINEPSSYIIEGNTFTGVIRGVNKFGELQVDISGELRTFGHQEIQFQLPNL